MMLKELITAVLVLGVFQADGFVNAEKTSDIAGEATDLLRTDEIDFKQMKNEKDEWIAKKGKHIKDEKDDRLWGNKMHKKEAHDHIGDHSDTFMKENEIESDEFVDKYNKYGKTFNPNVVDKSYKKHKEAHYHDKKHGFDSEKKKTLMLDTNVNYVKNNKKFNKHSEVVSEIEASKTKEKYRGNYQNKNEFYGKRNKKNFYQNLKTIDLSAPPKNNTVLMARYIVHSVDWTALGVLSGRSPTQGSPFVCSKAISDGIGNSSTGVPYFFLSSLDLCTQDTQKNNRVSLLVTLSQTQYCKDNNLDPQDPRCAKLTMSGEMKRIKAGSEEENFAKQAIFSRHPVMEKWPADHNWYFAKLKIGEIVLLDRFGGATYIDVKDYLNAGTNPEK